MILVVVLAVLLLWWLWKEVLFFLAVGCITMIVIGVVVVLHQVQSMS